LYAGRDFDPSDEGESELYSFDFAKDMQPRDAITSAVWTCSVAAISDPDFTDPSPNSHITGSSVFAGTKTTQRVSGLLPGVTYTLRATVHTSLGDDVSLWSHVEVLAPA
jgi:hypothetical protein